MLNSGVLLHTSYDIKVSNVTYLSFSVGGRIYDKKKCCFKGPSQHYIYVKNIFLQLTRLTVLAESWDRHDETPVITVKFINSYFF